MVELAKAKMRGNEENERQGKIISCFKRVNKDS
jgi:hypothetical protein